MAKLSPNEKIEKACLDAKEKLESLNKPEFAAIIERLAWVLGSYSYDKNPVGLYEVGASALEVLKAFREEKPKMVAKKLVDALEEALSVSQQS